MALLEGKLITLTGTTFYETGDRSEFKLLAYIWLLSPYEQWTILSHFTIVCTKSCEFTQEYLATDCIVHIRGFTFIIKYVKKKG